MLENYEQFSKEKFLEDFKRKFNNVLKKSPIKASVKVYEPKVFVDVEGYKGDPIEFEFDYSLNIKKNIFNLRSILKEETFPIMEKEEVIVVDRTLEEKEELIHKEGWAVDKALSSKKEVKTVKKYRIERVIIDRDEIFIEEIGTNVRERYKLIGVSVFLYTCRNKGLNPKQIGELFFNRASFLNEIYSEEVWKNKSRFNREHDTNYITIVNQ